MNLPEGIRKHRAGYQVDVTEGGKRRRITVSTLQEAVQYRTTVRAELILSNAGKRTSKTLQDCYDQALIERWSRSRSEKSKRMTLLNAGIVLEFFGKETLVSAVGRGDIVAFDEYLRKSRGVCDGTINHYHAPLSAMLRVACEHGWIDTMPVIPHYRPNPGRIRWMDEREEAIILDQLKVWGQQDHWDCLVVLLDTGVRHSEMWQLAEKDCNFTWVNPETNQQTGLIHLWRTKTSKPRSLPMTKRVYEVLTRRRAAADKGYLFPYHGEENWDAGNRWIWNMWEKVKVVTGLNDPLLVPYCCRHTCATRLLQRGMKLEELQQWLGHTNITMTMRYAHLAPTALVKGAALLEGGPHAKVPGIGTVTVDSRM